VAAAVGEVPVVLAVPVASLARLVLAVDLLAQVQVQALVAAAVDAGAVVARTSPGRN